MGQGEVGELGDSDDRGCVLTPVALMGNARRSSAFDIPPHAITTRHRPSPCSRWRKGEGERLETADRVRVCTLRSLATRAHGGRGRAGRAGERRTRLRCSLSVSEPAVPLARIDVLCRLISVLALAFTMILIVISAGEPGRIWSVRRTRLYICTCSMCNVKVAFVGYGYQSTVQCDVIVVLLLNLDVL